MTKLYTFTLTNFDKRIEQIGFILKPNNLVT